MTIQVSVPAHVSSVPDFVSLPLRNRHFMLMLFAYSITLGVNVAWSSVLAINLEPLGISQVGMILAARFSIFSLSLGL